MHVHLYEQPVHEAKVGKKNKTDIKQFLFVIIEPIPLMNSWIT